MESWRRTWRDGFAPHLSTAGLEALAGALERDDARLLQGATTSPLPLACVQDWPVEAACPVTFCGWQDETAPVVGAAKEYFAELCFRCDQVLGGPAECRWLLNWWDDTPRDEARPLLLAEVRRELSRRRECAA